MSTPLQRLRLVPDTVLLKRGVYLLAEAIYCTAQAEAQGQLSHWAGVQLSPEELTEIERDAKEFIADWRNHFQHKARIRNMKEGLNYVLPSVVDCRSSRKRS